MRTFSLILGIAIIMVNLAFAPAYTRKAAMAQAGEPTSTPVAIEPASSPTDAPAITPTATSPSEPPVMEPFTPGAQPLATATQAPAPELTSTPSAAPTQLPTVTPQAEPSLTPMAKPKPAPTQPQVTTQKISDYLTIQTLTLANGEKLQDVIIAGPPTPPPGFAAQRAPVEVYAQSAILLPGVPGYTWVLGCSAVSGAMIAGYYDRTGYDNVYTGSTDGGESPLTDSLWPTWKDGANATYPNNPLIASHNGVDGRSTRGTIDDYWVAYGSTTDDPFITGGWAQHAWGDAIGDYMKTSQSNYVNPDGQTKFWYYPRSDKLTCADMETLPLYTGGPSVASWDGNYGRKLFYESRGYNVSDCYNQFTDNQYPGGFSFSDFKTEIDNGHPVLIHLAGHSIVGMGYDNSSNTIYIHDTWDTSTHTMTWGGSYSGMQMMAVSVVNLAPKIPPAPPALISPSGDIVLTQPIYKWHVSSYATFYELKVTDTDTSEVIIDQKVASSSCSSGTCMINPEVTLNGVNYKFEVAASNSYGTGSFSSPMAFREAMNTTPSVPVLISPSGDINDKQPTYQWNGVIGATSYQLKVTNTDSATDIIDRTILLSACDPWPGACFTIPAVSLTGVHYQFAVAAMNGVGQSDFSPPMSFRQTYHKPPAVPALSMPASGYQTNNPTPLLAWKSAANAVDYDLQIDNISTFDSLLRQDHLDIPSLNHSADTLPEGKYYWRVRAKNTDGVTSGWSNSCFFTIDLTKPAVPMLTNPANGTIVNGTPIFSWKSVTGASSYQLEYNNFNNNSSPQYISGELSSTSFKSPTIAATHPLSPTYWYVRAKDAAGNWSDWSTAFTVTVKPTPPVAPTLDMPANGAFTNNPMQVLAWKAVTYGAFYELEIAKDTWYTTFLTQDHLNIPGLNHPVNTLAEGKYYWRVRAKNVLGVVGPWSSSRYFTIDLTRPAPPVLNGPANNTISSGTPTFRWKTVSGATYYQFEYGATNDSNSRLFISGALDSTSYKPPTMPAFNPAKPYYWFVQAEDAAGNWSDWSAGFAVTVKPTTPAAPTLSAPASGYLTDVATLDLGWNAAAYGDTYEIQIDGASDFSSPNYTYTSDVGAASDMVGPLQPGKWYWRVRAINVNNVPGSWSSSRYFCIYSTFNNQFNVDGDLEGWEGGVGYWVVEAGSLHNNGMLNDVNQGASYTGGNFSDFTYTARMKMVWDIYYADDYLLGHAYGLVVRGVVEPYGYWSDGYYFVIAQTIDSGGNRLACFQVFKSVDFEMTNLTSTLPRTTVCSSLIHFSDWNTLKVVAQGTSMQFYINDNLMWSKTVSGLASGRLGVIAWDKGSYTRMPVSVDWATAGIPVSP